VASRADRKRKRLDEAARDTVRRLRPRNPFSFKLAIDGVEIGQAGDIRDIHFIDDIQDVQAKLVADAINGSLAGAVAEVQPGKHSAITIKSSMVYSKPAGPDSDLMSWYTEVFKKNQ
jgi:hypothetical protein